MSPASNWHGLTQGRLAHALKEALPAGEVIAECSVLTDIGVRVPGVSWASMEFLQEQQDNTPFTRAPEICVEISSPSNSKREIEEKVQAYLAAGAREVWLAAESGAIEIRGIEGVQPKSQFPVTVTLLPRRRGN